MHSINVQMRAPNARIRISRACANLTAMQPQSGPHFPTYSAAIVATIQVPKLSQNADALRLKSHAYDRHYV